jgi:HK97 gp10 family phage protein
MATITEQSVAGLADLKKQLETLPAKIEGNVMRGALTAALRVIMAEAKANVPTKSGKLAKSIKIRADRKAARRGFVNVNLTAGDKEAFYAHMIEYGTASFYTGSGESVGAAYEIKPKNKKALGFGGGAVASVTHPGVKPQPFMRPAVDSASGAAITKMADYIKKRLPKELNKVKK